MTMSNLRQEHKIGGQGMIVEVDEMHIAKRKNNVGQILRSQADWVLGGKCRETSEWFAVRVPARRGRDLIPVMRRFIHPGSIIVTDEWAGYTHVPHYFADRKKCNHSAGFVNHDEWIYEEGDIHTNNIENLWHWVREHVRVYTDTNGAVDREIAYKTYYDQFFQGKNMMQRIKTLLEDCGRVYPIVGLPVEAVDWVKFNAAKTADENEQFEDWWEVETGDRRVLKGYNVLGIGYEQFDGLAHVPEEIEDPDEPIPEHELLILGGGHDDDL